MRFSIHITGVLEGQEREWDSVFEENSPEMMEDFSPQIPKFQSRVNKKRTHHSEKTKRRS